MFFTKKREEKLLQSLTTEIHKMFGQKEGPESDAKKVVDLIKKQQQLQEDIGRLKEEKTELEIQHKKELTEVSFLVKMKEEKQKLEAEKLVVEVDKKTAKMEKELQEKYFEKTQEQNKEHQMKMESLTNAILTRLPDVNLAINQGYRNKDKED